MKEIRDGGSRIQLVDQPHEDTLYISRSDDPDLLKGITKANEKLRLETPQKPYVRMHLRLTPGQFERISKLHPEVHQGTQDDRRRAWERIAKLYPQIVAKDMRGKYHAGETLQRDH